MYFDIRAVNRDGKLVSIQLEANDKAAAERYIKGRGYRTVTVTSKHFTLNAAFSRHVKFPILLFSREVLSLLKAGLNLVEIIQALSEKERGNTQHTLNHILRSLHEGLTFSQSLQQLASVFPPLYVATVQASERTGDLALALSRYITYRNQIETIRKKIITASIYPFILMVVGSLVTIFLLVYVVPKFSHIYEDMGQNMPALSRILLSWGQILGTHSAAVVFALIAVVVIAIYILTNIKLRQWIGHQLWRLPVVGDRGRVYELARLYRTLSMLLQSGIPLVTALEMSSGLLSYALSSQLRLVIIDIRQGQPLSRAMECHGLSTPVALRMLRVGERSGQLGEMLDHIANFYDDELAQWVDLFTKLFEPILMTIIGLVIGTIVALMYMPVFELAGSLQ